MSHWTKKPQLADLVPHEQELVRHLAQHGSMPITQCGSVGGILSWFVEFDWAPGTKFSGMAGDKEPVALLTAYGKKVMGVK